MWADFGTCKTKNISLKKQLESFFFTYFKEQRWGSFLLVSGKKETIKILSH